MSGWPPKANATRIITAIITIFNAMPMAATASLPYGSRKRLTMTMPRLCMRLVTDAGMPMAKMPLASCLLISRCPLRNMSRGSMDRLRLRLSRNHTK